MPWDILSTRVLNRYISPLVDRRTNPVPANYVMLNRTPEVPRSDEEIIAGYTGHVFAADIIADDQEAVTKTADMIELKVNKVPNIKIGKQITQAMAALLYRIEQRAALPGEPDTFRNYVLNKYKENIQSIRIRQEVLLNAMSYGVLNYDSLGIKLQNVSFGMPAYTLVTPSTLFSNTASIPITVILGSIKELQRRHGKTYNRIEMSSTMFDYIVATDQFKAQANLFTSRAAFPTGSDPFANPTTNQNLLGQFLGMKVELRDEGYEEQLNDGSIIARRFTPENKIRLTNTGDDNDVAAREFSMAVPVEALMMNLPGVNVIGGATGNLPLANKPVAYASVKADLNPPNATLWAAAKGFPAKNSKIESLVITGY